MVEPSNFFKIAKKTWHLSLCHPFHGVHYFSSGSLVNAKESLDNEALLKVSSYIQVQVPALDENTMINS